MILSPLRGALLLVLLAGTAQAGMRAAPVPPPRPAPAISAQVSTPPKARPATRAVSRSSMADPRPLDPGFAAWREGFRARARANGISPSTLNAALADLRPLAHVIEADRSQSEFTRALWDYLDSAVSETRIRDGRRMLRRHARLFDVIERRHGVAREVVAAIWGIESAYGASRGDEPVIAALATLAHEGRRRAFFEAQLIAALRIVEAGDVSPEGMRGSWAGAMGHTQFIPASYLAYAVDFDGDGRRDIWGEDPADALASTAAYLDRFGWRTDQPWGGEVILPEGFDYRLAVRGIQKSAAEWAALGVRPAGGGRLADHGPASILLPAGARGPAFMIFANFGVIERYNSADAYILAVGLLSDRLAGRGGLRAGWPRGDRPLTAGQKRELQRRLTRAGFSTHGVDGIVGPDTIAAIRRYQAAHGLTPDGYASARLLEDLGG